MTDDKMIEKPRKADRNYALEYRMEQQRWLQVQEDVREMEAIRSLKDKP